MLSSMQLKIIIKLCTIANILYKYNINLYCVVIMYIVLSIRWIKCISILHKSVEARKHTGIIWLYP